MAFGAKPKKEKPKGWLCKCGITQPAYILFCARCNTGQK